jgi:GT2 family glycosyltransferase
VSGTGVVVVAFGSPDDLDRCLTPIAGSFEIVVVDNGSAESVAQVAARHGAGYVDSGANVGFAAGVNAGVSRIDPAADVLLLNPDAVLGVADVRMLSEALAADPALAAVSPRLVDEDGVEQRVWWPFPSPARIWWEAFGGPRLIDEPEEFVVGTALLVRRTAWLDVGGFDERFFLYAEEVDWQRRARDRGWTSGVAAGAVATHRGAGTSPDASRRDDLFHAAIETYVRKWFGRSGWAAYRAGAVVGASGRALVGPLPRRRAARSRATRYVVGPRRQAGFSGPWGSGPR